MQTYRARARVIKFDPGTTLSEPATASISFTFAPGQAFGTEPGGGRTAVRSVAATVLQNRQTGQFTVESSDPLVPIHLDIEDGRFSVEVRGNRVAVKATIASEKELSDLIETIYYGVPLILAADFADPPIITEVAGTVNGHVFGWNLVGIRTVLHTTTQQRQIQRIEGAWYRLWKLVAPENRRLLAALQYFHVAARLERVSVTPGEFLSEALLNYAKILEVLFTASTKEMRRQLATLGFATDAVERDFIPTAILRSNFDVAHVSLVLLTSAQLEILQRFADRAEVQFRDLLSRVMDAFDKGTLILPPYEMHAADKETANTIERIAHALSALGDRA